MIRRHHLIEEAKAELDAAYDEVKRAELKVMMLENQYQDQISLLEGMPGTDEEVNRLISEKNRRQEMFGLEALYDMQKHAIQRLSVVSSAFAIIGSIEDEDKAIDMISRLLFRDETLQNLHHEVHLAIRTFQRALREYIRKESTTANDSLVRENWAKLEAIMRGLGRQI